MAVNSAWDDVKTHLDRVFGQPHLPDEVLKKLAKVSEALEKQQDNHNNQILRAANLTDLMNAQEKQAAQLAGAMARAVNREPKWIVFCMALSALGGVLALTAAVLHAVKQVNQLHKKNDASDEALLCPLAPPAPPKIHIDHYTPMMLALMSLLRWPHSIYIKDRKMLFLQTVNVLVWGGITVYVWVNDPHPSLPHVDL